MSYDVTIEDTPSLHALSVRFECAPAKITEHLQDIYPRVYQHVVSNGGEPAGPPFLRYHAMTEDEFKMDAGLPVKSAMENAGDIEATSIGGVKVATTVHKGPYEGVGGAHEAIHQYLESTHWESAGACWDSYVDDPEKVAAEDVRTVVCYPVTENADST